MPKYRSGLEERVAALLDEDDWDYEPIRVPYTMEKKYIPDFVNRAGDWIEVKGRLDQRSNDVQKYIALRKCYPEQRIIFVWSHPNNKTRKGAKMTNAQWCEKHGFEWTTPDAIEEEGI